MKFETHHIDHNNFIRYICIDTDMLDRYCRGRKEIHNFFYRVQVVVPLTDHPHRLTIRYRELGSTLEKPEVVMDSYVELNDAEYLIIKDNLRFNMMLNYLLTQYPEILTQLLTSPHQGARSFGKQLQPLYQR